MNNKIYPTHVTSNSTTINLLIKLLIWLTTVTVFVVFFLIVLSSRAHAEGNVANLLIRGPNTFYAYVEAGESLNYDFTQHYPTADTVNSGVRVYVTRPGGSATQYCNIASIITNPPNTFCRRSNLTHSSAGVWKIEFVRVMQGGPERRDGQLASEDNTFFSWMILVRDSGGNQKLGRVWAETHLATQKSTSNWPNNGRADFNPTFVSKQGYRYQGHYFDYMGIDSVIYASSHGLVDNVTDCNIQYKSIAVDSILEPYLRNAKACGDLYKLFFRSPSPDLPATATNWDGNPIWILPADPALPAINLKGYVQDEPNSGKPAGTLSYTTSFNGNVNIEVTVTDNNNPLRTKTTNHTHNAKEGIDNLFKFSDNSITGENLSIKYVISYGKPGEIHFVNTDAERRGGIGLTRLNGGLANRDTLYWDDTELAYPGQRCSFTPLLKADPQVGYNPNTGVHGWLNDPPCALWGNSHVAPDSQNPGSWGNMRNIHDWTYDPDSAVTEDETYTLISKNKAYFKVYNGDVVVGSTFQESDGTCPASPSPAPGIRAYANPVTGGYAGASAELGVHALGKIEGFYSASLSLGQPIGLTFGNYDGSGSNFITQNNGGFDTSGAARCMPDYFEFFKEKNGGNADSSTGYTINSASDPRLSNNYLVIDGDLNIEGNIVSATSSWASIDDIKPFFMVVKGNINIDPGVTQLDGMYIAQPRDDGTGGTINTCYSNDFAQCEPNALVVNGAFVAKKVKFNRLGGDVADATLNQSANSGKKVAETFNFTPELFFPFLNPGETDSWSEGATSIVGLPPIL